MTAAASASASANTSALQGLKDQLGDRILLDEDVRTKYRTDYGGFIEKLPGAVALCQNTDEVAQVVRYCYEHGISITPRGQAHSQSGQSCNQDGVLLDTSSMQRIHEIDEEGLSVTCDAGVVWRDLVKTVVPMGLVPPTLTNNLGVTICGTLSIAGLGVASFRYGAQVDNALEIEVVTGTGEVMTCSREHNRELFDVVRSGFGQFGVMTKANIRLRKAKSRVRKYYLLYDDLGALMEDSKKVMAQREGGPFDTLESWCSPCPQGTKRIGEGLDLGEGMQVFAYWMYPLHLTVEYEPGEEPDDAALLGQLNPYKHLETVEFSHLEFCDRLVPIFQLWDRSGYSDMMHPWMETVLPWDKAQEYIDFVLGNLPPQTLGPGGHILLWPCRGDVSDAPLFMHPGGDYVMGWGILPAVPPKFIDQALAQLDMASELSFGYDGKRYLSGYITFNTVEQWAAHFGDQWPRVLAAKKKYDPAGILAPGFIQYE